MIDNNGKPEDLKNDFDQPVLCPIPSVHIRLDDARRLWLQATEAYPNPSDFRVSLNACIQALRTVTFVLQKQKSRIHNFDAWYSPWQNKMKNDEVMKWLIDARNRIEKEGDLEKLSTVDVRLSIDWGKSIKKRFRVNPLETTEMIASSYAKKIEIPSQLKKDAILIVERRWVAKDLPAHELLDALAHAFGFLSLIVNDAHRHLGINGSCHIKEDSDGQSVVLGTPKEYRSGRIPCMVGSEVNRTVWIKLETGEQVSPSLLAFKPKLEEIPDLMERYKIQKSEPVQYATQTLKEQVAFFFNHGKNVLQKDGYHQNIVLLIGPGNHCTVCQIKAEDRAEKFILWERLGSTVEQSGVETIISLGEMWLTIVDRNSGKKEDTVSGKRRECFSAVGASKNGDEISFSAEFTRNGDKIDFSETRVFTEKDSGMDFLEPVRRIWEKKNGIPKKHINANREAYQPAWLKDGNLPCPCGSGLSFDKCCKDNLPQESESIKPFDENNIDDVEKKWRGALAKYVGSIFRDTLPIVMHFPDNPPEELIHLDINVLDELVSNIAFCLEKRGKGTEIIDLFDYLIKIIPLPGLNDRMLALKVHWLDSILGNHNQALNLLANVNPDKVTDRLLLQVCLDLLDLPVSKAVHLIDRILLLTEIPAQRLQYKVLKAVYLSMLNEDGKAFNEINEAICKYTKPSKEISDIYHLNWCARGFAERWKMQKNDADYSMALEYYNKILVEELTPDEKADIQKEIDEFCRQSGNLP
jgi:hypothetical protein